ncbi:serine/threonine-protein kinase [Streptomyces sp. NPDC046866]|uniref:serine/threonine-protein kinase n=1 Tax=Streptomyces sp. NPDC046866 TaxID=3154921 RepID=UPI0034516AA0
MQPLEAGEPRTIGAYRLLGRLGSGGMGRVYLGRSAGGRTVAVKIVHPHFATDGEFRERFRREVEAARRVGGEWTAPVLDADPEAPVPWVATGYVAGPSLAGAVAAHGPLPHGSVRAVGEGLARALVAVHGLGLVHRDVKPSNVMLTVDGPRLIDFGIARATDGTASLTSTGVSVGSPGYMSPEQILGKGVTGAADVFSLGAVLAFAATGRPPFSGDNSATLLYKVVHEAPELDEVPAQDGLRELVAACLDKSAAARPAPEEVAAALEGALLAPGRLPAPVLEEASRAAVALLDLEAAEPEPATGPAPFATPSYGDRVPAGGMGAGMGSFGAPDPAYGDPAGAPYAAPAGPYGTPTPPPEPAPGQTPTQTGGGGASVPQPRTAPGREGDGGGRKVSVTAAGRRLSCTVVVAAAAVAVALSGGLYGLGLLPGGGSAKDGGAAARPPHASASEEDSPSPSESDASSTPDPSGSASGSTSGGTRHDVPKELIGTWKGTVTTARLGVSTEFEITIKAGKVGEVVGRDKSILPGLGTDCSGDWKLGAATDRSLILDTTDNPNPAPGICSHGSDDERFTLKANGKLHYRSGDGAAGNPEGDLTRIP